VTAVDPWGLAGGWHFDYTKEGERLIHYAKYRFNKAGELVEHCGKVIKNIPKGAKDALEYLKNVKPNFFRSAAPLFIFEFQIRMLDKYGGPPPPGVPLEQLMLEDSTT
jgi:hypothetical protein